MNYKLLLLALFPVFTECSQNKDVEVIQVQRITVEALPAFLASLSHDDTSGQLTRTRRICIKNIQSLDDKLDVVFVVSESDDEDN